MLLHLQAQDVLSVKQYSTAIASDNWSNLYVITPDNTLLKYNSEAQPIASFSPRDGSRIENVDAGNPFKIILKLQSENPLLVIDNRLAAISSAQVHAFPKDTREFLFCTAPTGGIRIYSPENSRLMKFNDSYEIEYERNLGELPDNIIKIAATSSFIFFQDNNERLYIFNSGTGSVHPLEKFRVKDFCTYQEEVLFFAPEDDRIRVYNPEKRTVADFYTFSEKKKLKHIARSSSFVFYTDEERIYFRKLK
ncbi:MAG: hypothetical protein CSB06_01180 [Bacteroidia bacterium]|nr:MAG: hypothetical protein CSB06_01180 [Bacteroidia bacterium]